MPLLVTPQRTWTFDDLQHLPDLDSAGNEVDWRRFEILDGALVMSPPPAAWHELTGTRLRAALTGHVPTGFTIVGSLGIAIGDSYLIPDLVVARTEVLLGNARLLRGEDALLAIEVVSPGSRTMDRVTKPARYAAAGIRGYWRVETEPAVSLTAYILADGDQSYSELGSWSPGQLAEITEPFAVSIAVDALVPTR